MNKIIFSAICIVTAALITAAVGFAQGPTRDRDLIPFYEDIRGGTCSTTMFAAA